MTVLLDAPVDAGTLDFKTFDAYFDSLGVIFHEGEGVEQISQSIPARPVRQDTGQNPFETRPESGDIFSQGDFRGGMGQAYLHRRDSDPKSYFWSRGVDVSEGPVSLRKTLTEVYASKGPVRWAATDALLAGVDEAATATAIIKTTNLTSFSTETISAAGGATNNYDITTDGSSFYIGAVDGTTPTVFKRTSGGTWSILWTPASGTTVRRVLWTKGRLIAVVNDGKVYEVTAAGVGTQIDTLPASAIVEDIFTAGGFIYIAFRYATRSGEIWHYGTNSAGTAIERKGHTEFPDGFVIQRGAGYVGRVYLGGFYEESTGNTQAPIFFVGEPDDDGFLSYALVDKGKNELSASSVRIQCTAIYPTATTVYVHWDTGDADPFSGQTVGVGMYDITNGAWSLLPSILSGNLVGVHGAAMGITTFDGRLAMGFNGKTYAQSKTVYTTTGTLITSMGDWNNAGLKTWRWIDIAHKPLPASCSIEVFYTTKHPEEGDWTSAGTSNVQGSEGKRFDLSDVESRVFALKLVLTGGSTETPTLLSYSARSDPKAESSEYSLVRTIRVKQENRSHPGAREIVRPVREQITALRNLHQTEATLYEPGETWDVYVKEIRVEEPKQAINKSTGGSKDKEMYVVTLQMEGTRQ